MESLLMYKNNGRIYSTITASSEMIESSYLSRDLINYLLIDGKLENPEEYYINSRKELEKKTEYSKYKYEPNLQVGDEISIYGIPFDSAVTWPDGFTEIITDGFVKTTATLEGEYKFIIDHPAYFPAEVIINATP